MTTMPYAERLFDEANQLIGGDRKDSYGDVAVSFAGYAKVASAILGVDVTPEQGCLLMLGLKICREAHAHKHDNLVDVCGYAGLLEELHARKNSMKP